MFIKQIHKQKEDVVRMWGIEYKMIALVTIVREINHSSTKITYTLEDITGELYWSLAIPQPKLKLKSL